MSRHRPPYLLIVSAIAGGILFVVYFTAGERDQGHAVSRMQPQDATRPPASAATGSPPRDVSAETSAGSMSSDPDGRGASNAAEDSNGRNVAAPGSRSGDASRQPDSGRFDSSAGPAADETNEAGLEIHADTGSELPCWQLSSNLPENHYSVSQDTEQAFSGESSARIDSTSSNAQFGTLSQTINAAAFAGERVDFSAFLRFEDVSRGVSLWVFATDASGDITVSQRLDWIPGSLDWHSRSITVDVPAESIALTYAFNITGEGTLWVDDARVIAVPETADLTFPGARLPDGRGGRVPAPDIDALPGSARNTDFELWDTDDANQRRCADELP